MSQTEMGGAETMFKNKLEFKGAVIGMLLGDACLAETCGKSVRLQMGHSIKQKEYLMHKKDILEWLTGCNVYNSKQPSKDGSKIYESVCLHTKTHPLYKSLKEHLYFNGRRTIDEHCMKCLTPLGLALWYQDDGTLKKERNREAPVICSYAYSKTEVELMARMLHKKFGMQWRCQKNGKYFLLRLRQCDKQAFIELIRPYIVPSMEYKIRSDGNEPTNFGKLVEKICKTCQSPFCVQYGYRHRAYCGKKCFNSRNDKRLESQASA